MKKVTIKAKYILLMLAVFMLISGCASVTGTWNPNEQPAAKLATLKLVNNTKSMLSWEVVSAGGRKLSKPWVPNEDTIKISTEEHILNIGVVEATGSLVGGTKYKDEELELRLTKLLEPGESYVLKSESGFFSGPTGFRFVLIKESFLIDSEEESWKVEAVKDDEDSLISTVTWKIVE